MGILITGADGQLGRALQHKLAGSDLVALNRRDLDVSDAAAVDAAIARHRPEVVIHAAALTDTARCERESELAAAVNAAGAGHVAGACARTGARCIAISTNEVFDGEKRTPYFETDATHALNAYGASKLEGERLALAACADTVIVRTSWLYGDGGAHSSFIEKVLAAARAGRPLRFVTDEVATPTSAADLARSIRTLIEQDAPPGIYHLGSEGEASRYDWVREILRFAGMADVAVAAVTTEQLRAGGYAGPMKPAYSVLANTRARALGIVLPPWQQALASHFERARVAADG
jgi:dTDP-4-dehydrorhamnose reductase